MISTTISFFARKNKSENPKNETIGFINANLIDKTESVKKIWEAKEKYELYFSAMDGLPELEIVNIYELDSDNVVVMTDNKLDQCNKTTKMSEIDFLNRLKVIEIKVLYRGSKVVD